MRPLPPVIVEYFRCMNDEDWTALPAALAPDAVLEATGGRRRSGRADVVTYFPRALAGWATHRDTPTRWMADGPTHTVEIRFDGTDVTGTAVTFEAVDVFDLTGGTDPLIARVTTWYDVDAVRRQVGAGRTVAATTLVEAVLAGDLERACGLLAPRARWRGTGHETEPAAVVAALRERLAPLAGPLQVVRTLGTSAAATIEVGSGPGAVSAVVVADHGAGRVTALGAWTV